MKEITIDNRILGYMALFEKVARVELKECLENEDMVLFVVLEKKLAEMFKRNDNAIAELKERINKHILVVEYSRDLILFVKNIFYRFGVKEININWKEGQTNVLVTVEQNEVGKAIGKEGRNIKLFRDAVQRYYNIKSLNIKQI
ncbi:MAG: NusA-like transcription termination signal-binding factor [Thermoplasmataceae archaeon]|jgi:N utilization substance protein A|nr:NusA-like transcription termination signal-binding factor [Candidatus Thermoplasmatota archaeon]